MGELEITAEDPRTADVREHVLAVARRRGYRRVSLETGTMKAFAPARALYRSMGFEPCEPIRPFWVSPISTCMTLVLDRHP